MDQTDFHPPRKRIFKLNKKDFIVAASMLFSIFVIWFHLASQGKFRYIMSYGDAFEYVFVAQHFYRIPIGTPEKIGGRVINQAILCQVLPGVPLVLRLLRFLCFGSWACASVIYIIVTAVASSILFHRFLKTWRLVRKPTITACLFSVFPIRHLAFHSVVNSDSLFLCCVFLCLIGYKRSSTKTVNASLAVAVMTHPQGIVLTLSMIFLYFLRDKSTEIAKTAITSLCGYLCVMVIQKILTDASFGAYWMEKFVRSKQFSCVPFASAFLNSLSISSMRKFHTLYGVQISGLIGVGMTFNSSVDFSMFSMMFLVYVSLLNYGDIFHETITYEIVTILVGLDAFISSQKFIRVIPVFIIIYGIGVFILTQKGIASNPRNDVQ